MTLSVPTPHKTTRISKNIVDAALRAPSQFHDHGTAIFHRLFSACSRLKRASNYSTARVGIEDDVDGRRRGLRRCPASFVQSALEVRPWSSRVVALDNRFVNVVAYGAMFVLEDLYKQTTQCRSRTSHRIRPSD